MCDMGLDWHPSLKESAVMVCMAAVVLSVVALSKECPVLGACVGVCLLGVCAYHVYVYMHKYVWEPRAEWERKYSPIGL